MVVRLGETSGVGVVSQRYRIKQGQTLSMLYVSDTAAARLRCWARVRYDNGEDDTLFVADTLAVSDPITLTTLFSDVARMDGWVTDALVECLTAGVQRGQIYVRLFLDPFGPVLCSDYCYSSFGQIALGTYIQPGPGGGMGNLMVETFKADGAPAASTTYLLRSPNIVRKVSAFSWFYESSVDVATRVLDVKLLAPLGAAPSGIGAGATIVWSSVNVSLTASQDGMIFADEQRSGSNDNATLAIDDAAANPTPFPLWGTEDMAGAYTLVFSVALGEVLDNDAIYGLVEEWVLL